MRTATNWFPVTDEDVLRERIEPIGLKIVRGKNNTIALHGDCLYHAYGLMDTIDDLIDKKWIVIVMQIDDNKAHEVIYDRVSGKVGRWNSAPVGHENYEHIKKLITQQSRGNKLGVLKIGQMENDTRN